MQDFKALKEKLIDIAKLLPDKEVQLSDDFFSISGFPHFETVLSNWFAYFMESNNEHNLAELFSNSFREVLLSKNPELQLDWLNDLVHVEQEKLTNKRKFIDFVIYDEKLDEDSAYGCALIVEHKVQADLYNDLEDYYNSIQSENKTGVVLSAYSLNLANSKYINLTYNELIDALRRNLGLYVDITNLKSLAYLKDFINNLNRMSEDIESDALSFCFEHGETIKKVADIKKKAEEDLANVLRNAFVELEDFRFQKKHPYSISIRSHDDSISLVFSIDEIFSSNTSKMQYWLYGKVVEKWNKIEDHKFLKEKFKDKYQIMTKKEGKEWVEVLRCNISFCETQDTKLFIEEFMSFITTEVREINEVVLKKLSEIN